MYPIIFIFLKINSFLTQINSSKDYLPWEVRYGREGEENRKAKRAHGIKWTIKVDYNVISSIEST